MRIEKGHKEEANVVDKKRACEYQKRACLYHFPYLIAPEVLAGFCQEKYRLGADYYPPPTSTRSL